MSFYPPFSGGAVYKGSTSGAAAVTIAIPATVLGQTVVIYNSSATIPLVVNLLGNAAVVPAADFTTATASGVIPPATQRAFNRGETANISVIRDGGSDVTFYIEIGDGAP